MKKSLLAAALLAATVAPATADAQAWVHWRETHRDVFHGGTWNAPFTYRTWNRGVILPREYWAPNYYVNDWSRYRLPAPGHWYHYVRHFNDLLLVDTRSGRIIRVYRNFYW